MRFHLHLLFTALSIPRRVSRLCNLLKFAEIFQLSQLSEKIVKAYSFHNILVSVALLTIASISFQACAVEQAYEANTLQIVMTPDGFPIIWKNAKKYSQDFTLSTTPTADNYRTLGLTSCYTLGGYNTSTCSAPASSGAYYYKDFYVVGVGNVRVFYDANGNIVGTQQTTQHMAAQGDFGSAIDNPDYAKSADVETVGTIAGAFEVSPSGAATYNISIVAPPGIAGMKPDIGLSYNSQAGNGLMGVGWSITGLSSITRCRKTIATDGIASGIEFDQAVFCLDGKRLLTSTSNPSEYRTEVESFARVTWSGTPTDPSEFFADTKSGLVYHYSPVFTGATNRTWVLDEIKDQMGNRINFQYIKNSGSGVYYTYESNNPDDNDYYISEIRYAYLNQSDDSSYNAKIVFNYDSNRTDVFSGWVAGDKASMRARLRSVETYSSNRLGRDYRLEYSKDPESGVSMLSGIKLCSGPDSSGNNECYRETSFSWLYANASVGTEYSSGSCSSGSACDNKYIYYPDLDGDGLADTCYQSDAGIKCYLGNGAGASGTAYAELGICGTSELASPASCRYNANVDVDGYTKTYFKYDGRYSVQFKDVNGDGLADLVYRSISGISYALSNGHGFDAVINTGIFPVSIPAVPDNYSGGYTTLDGTAMQYIYFPDARGNGVPDLCFRGYGIECHKSTGNSAALWESAPYFKPADPNNSVIPGLCQGGSNSWGGCDQADNFPTIRFIDLNGDGKDDLVYRSDSGLRAWFSTGSGFTYDSHAFDVDETTFYPRTESLCANEGSSCNQHNISSIQFADINGDGLPDLCYWDHNGGGVTCRINRGGADYAYTDSYGRHTKLRWQGLIRTGYCFGGDTRFGGCTSDDNYNSIKFVDLNGDGKADLVFRSNEGLQFFLSTGSGFNYYLDTDICGNGVTANGGCNDSTNWNTISFTDFNGDGRADLVYAGDAGIQRWINTDYKSNLITSITNGLGETATVDYKRLTDGSGIYQKYAVYINQDYTTSPLREIQAPISVVATASHDDGVGGMSSTSYHYEGLGLNLQGRGLLGFAYVRSTDSRSVETEITYRRDFLYLGTPISITKSLASGVSQNKLYGVSGNIISQITNVPASILSDANMKYPYISTSYENKRDPLQQTPTSAWLTQTTTDTTVDNYGNVTERKVQVQDGVSGVTYITDNNNEYTSTYDKQYGRVRISSVTKTEPDGSSQTKNSSFNYYANGLLKDEIIEPGGTGITNTYPVATQTTSYVYDGYGNITSKTVSAPDVSPRVTTTTYDTASQRFAETVTDPLGHTMYREYDPVLGKVTTQIGPYVTDSSSPINKASAVKKTWGYDGFGRVITANVIDQTGAYPTVQTTTQYNYCVICVRFNALYNVTSQTSDLPATTVDYDMLGREILQQTTGFDGTHIYTETQYDTYGQVVKKSRPYFADIGAQSDDWTTIHYDALGRPYQTDVPTKIGDSTATATTTTTYAGLTTITKNANNQVNTVKKDAIGRIVEVIDADNKSMTYQYTYVGNAEKKTVADAQDNQIIVYSDVRGNKREMHDPDMGVWTYSYDGLNELVSQTDARNVITTMGYDDLGRLTTRTNFASGSNTALGYSTSVDSWVYDTLYPGQLTSETTGSISKSYQYDSMGRANLVTTNMLSTIYTVTKNYDDLGRPDVLAYPDGFAIRYVYNNNGHLEKIVNNTTPTLEYWKANYVDAEGHITNIDYGNGINIIKGYSYGRLDSIHSGVLTDTQHDEYKYDAMGNMLSRSTLAPDGVTEVPESFTYDNLNRLKTDTQASVTATYQYDELGNLLNKPQVITGSAASSITYQYDTTHKKRLNSTGGAVSQSFNYDANGSMVSGGNRTYNWTTFNKLQYIGNGTSFESFMYDVSRTRARKYNNNGVTDYLMAGGNLGAQFESFKAYGSAAAVKKYFIYAGGALVAVKKVDNVNNTDTTEYMLTDNLGSVVMVTDDNANVLDRRSYGPFGEARSTDWASVYAYTLTTQIVQAYKATTTRGYTGHEQMVDFGLINMNGRIYDPVIGRFLSADSNVQDPYNMQSYNRYAYVMNNPLIYTDPSGHSINSVLRIGATIGFVAVVGPWAGMMLGGLPAGFAFATAAAVKLNGGSSDSAIMAGFTSAFSAGLYGAIGAESGLGVSIEEKILQHSIVGGLMSEMQGGTFKSGFFAAGFTKSFAGKLDDWFPTSAGERVFAAAVIGGTASVIGGGNFSNGAATGAFSRLFNDEYHDEGGGLSLKTKATILKFLQASYGLKSGKLSGAILLGDTSYNIKLNSDGSAVISTGDTRFIVNDAHDITGAGAKWRSLSVDISMPKNGVIMISGTGTYHVPYIPISFSATISDSIDVRYAVYNNSGLIGHAMKPTIDQIRSTESQVCGMGFSSIHC